eukprot:1779150-Amphidinium_carterae.1
MFANSTLTPPTSQLISRQKRSGPASTHPAKCATFMRARGTFPLAYDKCTSRPPSSMHLGHCTPTSKKQHHLPLM